jgi:hypothetical protein
MPPRVATNLTRYPRVSEYATGITGYVLPPSPSELLQRQNLVSVIRFACAKPRFLDSANDINPWRLSSRLASRGAL